MKRLASDILTPDGVITVLPVRDVIIAYLPNGRVVVHRVPDYGPIGYDDAFGENLCLLFYGLSENIHHLRVQRIEHLTDTVIGFFVPDRGDVWGDWGYAWNLTAPAASTWQRMSDVRFVDDGLVIERKTVANGIALASHIPSLGHDPQAVAGAEDHPEAVVDLLPPLIDWLVGYQHALDDKVRETTPHPSDPRPEFTMVEDWAGGIAQDER
jgi:hypothetical protein